MALKPFNSVAGFSVGEVPALNIILANGDITASNATLTGNLFISNATPNLGVFTDNLYYSNGVAWDLQEAAGSNNQIQFNTNNNFSASANLTFDPVTNLLTVAGNINAANADLGNLVTANFVNIASNVTTSNLTVNTSLSGNTANFTGNIAVAGIKTDNYYYANGVVVDFEQPAGSNTQIQFNDDGDFGASANLTFNSATDTFAVNGAVNVTGNIVSSNLTVNLTLSGNTANFSGNVVVPNLIVNTEISGNIANFSGNLTAQNANLGNLATANFVNVASNVNVTDTMQAGNVRTDNLLYANGLPWDLQEAAGSNTQIQFNNNNDFGASANLTFDFASNTLGVIGLVDVTGNANVSNTINGNIANFSGNLTSLNANLGNLATANYVNVAQQINGNIANFSGNLTSLNANLGNLVEANYVNVAQQINGNVANFSGNLTSLNANLGNLATASYVNVSSNVVTSNLTVNLALVGNTANFSGNLTSLNANLGNLATANYINVANDLNVVGNINAGNLVGILANGTSNVRIFLDANLEFSSNGVSNVVTITDNGLLVAGNIQATSGNILANGNVSANGYLLGANANITGTASIGILKTDTIDAETSTITMSAGTNGSIIFVPDGTGTIDASNFRITQVANPTQPRDATNKEYVDSLAGEGLTIHDPARVAASTNLVATYAGGGVAHTATDITANSEISFSVAHGLSVDDMITFDNTFNGITAGEGYFVSSVVNSTTITIKDTYFGATITTLTNGTGLTQNAVSNPGVGATLTNAGANAAIVIDTVTLANNDRVLVFAQTNGFENGVYIVSDTGNSTAAWVLTRSSDMDTYAPASPNAMTKGDYVFVLEGLTQAGASYVITAPSLEIIIGTDNVVFTEFSKAGSFTAGNGISITGTLISANVDNDTTAIVSGNIVVKTGANLVTPNLGDATFSSLTWNTLSNGNVTANNLSIGNIANITANLTVGGTIQANGTITSNANVSGLNLTTIGNVEASGNVLANNVNANTLITVPTANVSNIINAGNVSITEALTGNTANFSGNVLVNNLTVNLELAGNTANFSGNAVFNGANVTVGNVLLGNTANFTGDIIAANISANANLIVNNATVNLALSGNTANFTGNISAANANLGNLVTANYFTGILQNGTSNITVDLNSNINLTAAGITTLVVTNTGANIAGYANVTGNLTANNITVTNNINANIANIATRIDLGNTDISWATTTTTSISANQTIATFSVSGVTGIEFLVKGVDAAGSRYSVATVQAVTNGTSVDYATYGTVNLGGLTGILAVNIVGSDLLLQVSPASTNSTVWTTQFRTI
jgi:hypothetical protein